MGLDGVELVMEVEEHFGVTLTDEDAGGIRTVGDLLNLLEARVKRRNSGLCLSLPWFFRLRRLTRSAVGDDSLRPRPSHAVESVLSADQRKALWARLRELLGKTPPPLGLAPDLQRTIGWGSFGTALAATVFSWQAYRSPGWALATFICGWVVAWLLFQEANKQHRTHPPVGYRTFGEITRRLIAREAMLSGFPHSSRALLLDELSVIIAEQLGVDRDEVVPEARFVEDLNMD